MSRHIYPSLLEAEHAGAPPYAINEARESGRNVIKIVWDEDDIPEHCKGYIQWSVRPYRVTDLCDGTRDGVCHLVTNNVCKQLGIDMLTVYNRAYENRPEHDTFTNEYIAGLDFFMSEIEMPDISDSSLKALCRSLYDMNFRSFAEGLSVAFSEKGYDTLNY